LKGKQKRSIGFHIRRRRRGYSSRERGNEQRHARGTIPLAFIDDTASATFAQPDGTSENRLQRALQIIYYPFHHKAEINSRGPHGQGRAGQEDTRRTNREVWGMPKKEKKEKEKTAERSETATTFGLCKQHHVVWTGFGKEIEALRREVRTV